MEENEKEEKFLKINPNPNAQLIEIKGTKFAIDPKYAERVENFTVGAFVKVLITGYSEAKVYPGVVVGFQPFKGLPTIIIAYLNMRDYSSEKGMKFLYYNSKTSDAEIVLADPDDLQFDYSNALEMFDNEMVKLAVQIEDVRRHKALFVKQFGYYTRTLELERSLK